MKKFITFPLVIATACAMTACNSNDNDAKWEEPTNSTNPTNPTPIQTASLSGKVTNDISNQPVANATIKVGNSTATTDAQGNYSLTGLATGSTNIAIAAAGYATQNITHNLQANSNAIDFSLKPESVTVPNSPSVVAGTYDDCYNPAMEKVGNSWVTTTRSIAGGTNGVPQTSMVLPDTTYRGHTATNVQVTYDEPTLGHVIVNNYFRRMTDHAEMYGSTSTIQGATEFYYDPFMTIPLHMEINKPYTISYTQYQSGVAQNVVMTQTYLGKETVTTPAGTFEACKLRTAVTNAPAPNNIPYDNWTVASRQYKGLPLKQTIYNADGSIKSGTEVVALSANFK